MFIKPNGRKYRFGNPANMAQSKAANTGNKLLRKRVMCTNTGIVYESCIEAANELGLNRSQVSTVALGKKESCKGYKFKYV